MRQPADVLLDADRRHLIHPLHHPKEHAQAHIFVEGRGAMLRTADGTEYIDGLSALWNVNVGHGRKELADAAAAQMAKLAYASAYAGFSNEPAIRLAERIVGLAYDNMAAAYFTTSGAESNESAFKIARYYWKRMGKPNKVKIISRQYGYHGVTLAAMSATSLPGYHKMFGPLVPEFLQVAPPYPYRWPGNGDAGIERGRRGGSRDRGAGRRHDRRGDRRTGDGRGRRDRAAAHLFPAPARDLRPPRRAADRRRGDHRIRPHRALVRARTLGRASRT